MSVQKYYKADSTGKSVVMYRAGNGKEYPMKTVGNCKVCKAPDDWRFRIETALLGGASYLSIEKELPDYVDCSRRSISNHYREGHMPLEATHRRILIEEQAREMGLDPEESDQMLADKVTFAKTTIAQAFQKMSAGELEPDIKDALAAAAFLDRVEERQAGSKADVAALQEMIQVFFDAVMAEVGTDSVEAIARRAEGDPRMEGIRKKLLAASKSENN